MPTRTEIRYRFDVELARIASRRFMSRYQRGAVWAIVIALMVAALFALQQTWWAVSAFATIALIYTSILMKYRRAAALLPRRLGAPEVTVTADESGMTFSMPSYQSRAAWSPLREIWVFDDVWIFFQFGASAAYSAIPTSSMTPEFREMVLANMRAQGAKVG